jgi:predicted transport protein
MAQSPEEAMASMVRSLEAKTGKSMDEWLKRARASGRQKHGELVKWLKEEHGVTHGYANLIAHKTFGSDAVSEAQGGTDLVAVQYSGKKEALRPIYDALLSKVNGLGDDVEVSPKKAYVSLRRQKQFAIVQPSTPTRLDVGLNLKGLAPHGRLEASGSFNAMCTHRVRVEKLDDLDAELMGWVKKAYESAR